MLRNLLIDSNPTPCPNYEYYFRGIDNFYISYNPYCSDTSLAETSICIRTSAERPPSKFLILNGDHLKKYLDCWDLDQCIEYFNGQPDEISKWSFTL
jgi:hypothetical protein